MEEGFPPSECEQLPPGPHFLKAALECGPRNSSLEAQFSSQCLVFSVHSPRFSRVREKRGWLLVGSAPVC